MSTWIKLFLTTVLGCLLFVGCTDRTSMEKAKALEAEISQLTRLSSQAQIATKRLDAKIEAARQENERLKEANAKLQEELEAKSKEVDKLEKDFENYKLQYKLGMKSRVPGMQVADLLVEGVTYHHVKLRELTDTYLTISHDDGVRKVLLNQLPESLRDQLGLNIVAVAEPAVTEAVPAMSLKKETSARRAESNWAVSKATEQRSNVALQLDAAKTALEGAQRNLENAVQDHKPPAALKKIVEDQEKAVMKLEAELVQADIKLYQAKQERSMGLIAR